MIKEVNDVNDPVGQLFGRELNPGHLRIRQGYSPLYYQNLFPDIVRAVTCSQTSFPGYILHNRPKGLAHLGAPHDKQVLTFQPKKRLHRSMMVMTDT